MNGRSESEILKERNEISQAIDWDWDCPYVLDSFILGAERVNPLYCLGQSLMFLSKAQCAIFVDGWENSRGCKIEYEACKSYGIETYEAQKVDNEWVFLPIK